MSSFLRNIQNFSHKNALWETQDRILIAVSGGPDSICLLDTLSEIGKKLRWMMMIAHVNYGIRGKDSDADEMFVKDTANRYSIPISILRPKIPPNTSNLEEALRDIRYRFFETLRKNHKLRHVAVGHTLDDQAETVLMRLLRGSGPRGLSSMQPKEGSIIRPFLGTSRNNVIERLRERGLSYRIDNTNSDPKFTRNRIRKELIPLLETFNPNIRQTLSKTAFACRKDKRDFERDLLRVLMEISSPSKRPPSWNTIEEMLKMVRSTKPKYAKKGFQTLKIEKKGGTVQILLSGKPV